MRQLSAEKISVAPTKAMSARCSRTSHKQCALTLSDKQLCELSMAV